MAGSDRDELYLQALGENVIADEQDAELDVLKQTVQAARRKRPSRIETPPADLWSGIEATTKKTRHPNRSLRPIALAVAAAGIATVLSIGAFSLLEETKPTTVSEVQLASGAGKNTTGSATLLERNGEYEIELDLASADVASGEYRELWLIKADASDLVSLGRVATSGTYKVPQKVDINAFPIVDVSNEPADGDPAHSGSTLCRGTLQI